MKYILTILLIICILPPVHGATLARTLPGDATPGETVDVILSLEGAEIGERVVIGELLPEGATFVSWEASSADDVVFEREGNSVAWDLTVAGPASITYKVKLPDTIGKAEFEAVYAYAPDGYGAAAGSLQIVAPVAPPVAEAPAPVPVDEPEPIPFIWETMLLMGALLIMGLYLRHRLKQYSPSHSSFVDGMNRLSRDIVKALGFRYGLLVPSRTPNDILDEFPRDQQAMLSELGRIQRENPSEEKTLEDLKEELRSIKFSYA